MLLCYYTAVFYPTLFGVLLLLYWYVQQRTVNSAGTCQVDTSATSTMMSHSTLDACYTEEVLAPLFSGVLQFRSLRPLLKTDLEKTKTAESRGWIKPHGLGTRREPCKTWHISDDFGPRSPVIHNHFGRKLKSASIVARVSYHSYNNYYYHYYYYYYYYYYYHYYYYCYYITTTTTTTGGCSRLSHKKSDFTGSSAGTQHYYQYYSTAVIIEGPLLGPVSVVCDSTSSAAIAKDERAPTSSPPRRVVIMPKS